LIFASAWNRADAIRALLAGGANPDLTATVVDLEAQQALDQLASRRQREVLEAFGLEEDSGGATPAQIAAAALAAREVLRAAELPPDEDEDEQSRPDDAPITSVGGLTALLHAVRQGHREAAVALLDGGADVDAVSASDGTTPLLMAAINGQFDL